MSRDREFSHIFGHEIAVGHLYYRDYGDLIPSMVGIVTSVSHKDPGNQSRSWAPAGSYNASVTMLDEFGNLHKMEDLLNVDETVGKFLRFEL